MPSMDWLRDLGEFLWAVITNWAGYVTGGIIVALLWLWTSLVPREIPRETSRRIAIVLTLVFLLIAVFNAWREQKRAAAKVAADFDAFRISKQEQINALQKQLQDLNVPKLTTTFDDMKIGPAGPKDRDTLLIATFTITNTGAPTIIRNFGFGVKCANGFSPHLTSLVPSAKVIQLDTDDGQHLSLAPDRWLPRLVSNSPIAHNDAKTGFMMYKADGIAPEDFGKQSADITFTYFDVYGTQTIMGGRWTPGVGIGTLTVSKALEQAKKKKK